MVSTNAATSAATKGAAIENHSIGRRRHVRPAPPGEQRAGQTSEEEERAACRRMTSRGSRARRPSPAAVPRWSPCRRQRRGFPTRRRRCRGGAGRASTSSEHRQRVEDDAGADAAPRARRGDRVARRLAAGLHRLKTSAAIASSAACHHGTNRRTARSRPSRCGRAFGRIRRAGARPSVTSDGDTPPPVVEQVLRACLRWRSSACQPTSVPMREGSPSITGLSDGRNRAGSLATRIGVLRQREQHLQQVADAVGASAADVVGPARPSRSRPASDRRARCRARR